MTMKRNYLPSTILLVSTFISGFILSSSTTSADDVVDQVNISVPISCSLEGTGMNSHNATINNGTYNSAIGETTMKAFCNDNEGFAIYAIGYTDDTDGKNVLASSTLGSSYDIATGTATSGNTSNWAMKLSSTITNPTPTYPITIENSFDSFHNVPNEYTLVAKRTSGTDIGTEAEGSTLKSTYQAYIAPTQTASTYTGQVKYVLVHPHLAPEPILDTQTEIIFNGNGLTFPNGLSTNRVVYEKVCTTDAGYVSSNYQERMTPNINTGGVQNGSYQLNEPLTQPITISNADKLKIVIEYGISDAMIAVITGTWDGENEPDEYKYIGSYSEGEDTYIIDGDTATFFMNSWNEAEVGYDFGFYAKVYPIYDEEVEGTTYEVFDEECNIVPQIGAYAETTTWNDFWYMMEDGYMSSYYDENEIKWFIEEHQEYLGGQTLTLYAYNPNTIVYDGNNATAGTMEDFSTTIDGNTSDDKAVLFAPNYYRTGYGFAGWSTDQNATVNGNSKIYGPSEIVTGDEIFSNGTHQVTLYAVWVPTNGTMQNFSCSSLSSGEVTALSDSRDTNVYTVGKMQDGKCWMMENLRLDAANSLDSTKAQGYGGNFVGLADPEDENFTSYSTTANSLYSTSNITGDNQSNRFPRYNNNHTKIGGTNASGTPLVPIPDYNMRNEEPVQWYGYGNYYTWAAAIADTTDYTTETNTTTSICPSNWHLPTTTESNELIEAFGGIGSQATQNNETILRQYNSYPNNFVYSGYYVQQQAQQYGDDLGEYWLSTNKNNTSSYELYLQNYSYGSYIHPTSDNGRKYTARPVRCIAN